MKYVPLFDGILESTLWDEPLEVRTLYFTLLLLMDADFVVRLDFEKIARKARLRADRGENYLEAQKAMKVLLAPDALTMAQQKDDGIRVRVVTGGYFIVSGAKYQELMFEVNLARKRRRAQQERRRLEKEALMRGAPITGEASARAALERGDEATADHLAAERRVSSSGASNEAGKMDKATEAETAARATGPRSTSGPRLPAGLRSPPAAPQSTRATVSPSNPALPQVPATSAPLPVGQNLGPVTATPKAPVASVPSIPQSPPAPSRAPRSAGQVLSGMKMPRLSASNPFGGWQEKVVGSGTSPNPGAEPARNSGNPSPAAPHYPNSPESSEEEPATE